MKICFYNTHSAGDLIFTRGILNWISDHIDDNHEIYYYHNQKINSIPFHKRVIEKKYDSLFHTKVMLSNTKREPILQITFKDNEIYINTIMYSSKSFNKLNNYDTFSPNNMNTVSVQLQAVEIISFLNKFSKNKIPIPNELDILPKRTKHCKNKEEIDDFFSKNIYEKTFLICNGDSLSGQSENVSLHNALYEKIQEHKNYLFIFTENHDYNKLTNTHFISEFLNNNTIGDIEYMSKYADVLIGKSSGPSHTFFNYENCYLERKIIVELTHTIERAFFHKKGIAKYIWSNKFEKQNLVELIDNIILNFSE